MAPSFVTISCLLVHVVNSMEWRNIWSDECDTQGSWSCKVGREPDESKSCKLDANEGCQSGKCYQVEQGAYIERSVSIADYSGRPLRLSLYVSMANEPEWSTSDRCRIWLAYNDEDHDINNVNYDWQCSYPCGDQDTYIDISSSTTSDTLNIALGTYDKYHTHCYFDSLALEYQLPPTPAPTARPTPSPTKQPTDATPSPTPSPTETPTKPPSPTPTKQPTLTPTSHPSPAPSQPPTVIPTYVPSHDPTQNPSHHPIVTAKNTMQDANGGVSTTANRGDTVRASRGQDPILFVYVAASSIWLILILTCVVA
eukprot:383246_1